MSLFNNQRLPDEIFRIDIERMRRGWYTDVYFANTSKILTALAGENYTFQGDSDLTVVDCSQVTVGDIIVEMQFFTRRKPFAVVAGVDEALAILRNCTGYFANDGSFVNTYRHLEVEAVQDGTLAYYGGNPQEVQPVLKVRGRYRDVAQLETPILGALTEATRLATNVFKVLVATKGKDVLFFPARFAHYKLQAIHGYAYSLAVQAYNHQYQKQSQVLVSTDDQADWWGGSGGGTIAHATIACFLGDVAETMVQFARIIEPQVARIALVDFHNDCVGDTLKVMNRLFKEYLSLYEKGDLNEARRYKLFGVRPDTSGNMIDKLLADLKDEKLLDEFGATVSKLGVNAPLVFALREAIDQAYLAWGLTPNSVQEIMAQQWCQDVKIVVTGGFDVPKINQFEAAGIPVDIYGVGSSLLANDQDSNTDYTADIVKVKIDEQWYDLAKVGRKACSNPNLVLISE